MTVKDKSKIKPVAKGPASARSREWTTLVEAAQMQLKLKDELSVMVGAISFIDKEFGVASVVDDGSKESFGISSSFVEKAAWIQLDKGVRIEFTENGMGCVKNFRLA